MAYGAHMCGAQFGVDSGDRDNFFLLLSAIKYQHTKLCKHQIVDTKFSNTKF